MYTTYNILPVLPIKDPINKDGEPTTPFKVVAGTKPSVSHLRVFFCPCVLMESYFICWDKGVKYASPSAKVFLRYPHWNSTSLKSVYYLCTTQTGYNILIQCCFWWYFIYCVGIYVTTICRSDGYANGCVIYNLCYILKGTNWRYNHVQPVWRGEFMIRKS